LGRLRLLYHLCSLRCRAILLRNILFTVHGAAKYG
jgi:hypothetical protein